MMQALKECCERTILAFMVVCSMSSQVGANGVGKTDEKKYGVREKAWYREAFASSTPSDLMSFLPDSLVQVHGRSVADTPDWYENEWSLGRPRFYVSDCDTSVSFGDTLIAVLFTDGQVAQVVPVALRQGHLEVIEYAQRVFYTGVLCHFWRPRVDFDADGRWDVVVVFPAGAHATNVRPYLLKRDRMVSLGEFSSDMSSFDFADLDGDGTLELVAKSRLGNGGGEGALRTVFKLDGDTLRQVSSETEKADR